VKLYTEYDLLGGFIESMQEIAGPDVVFPERPALGSLDITGVLDSEFFFS
jgi:DNA-directed RNA polymerase